MALVQGGTRVLVPHPNDSNIVICTWIFSHKYNVDGTINHHKACLVAYEFSQQYGVDYKETLSQVVHLNLVHLLISIAINQGQPLHQLDVSIVFFYGDLTEGMFTKKPLSLYSSWGDCQDMPPSSCYLRPDANPTCITKSSKFSHTT